MVSTLSTLFIIALATAVSAASTQHQQEMREHYQHIQHIAEFTCQHPQPRTISVKELLTPYETRGKAYFPELTVLHRCDEYAGCCDHPGQKCKPLHADNVHLPFKVTYTETMGVKDKGSWEMEYHFFDNHTVCGCGSHDEHEVKHQPINYDQPEYIKNPFESTYDQSGNSETNSQLPKDTYYDQTANSGDAAGIKDYQINVRGSPNYDTSKLPKAKNPSSASHIQPTYYIR